MLISNSKSMGNHVGQSVLKKKKRLQWEGFAENEVLSQE